MRRLLRIRDIRSLESRLQRVLADAAERESPMEHASLMQRASLMERAGAEIAREAREMVAEVRDSIVVLAGPGNNGGDGLVAARLLRKDGYRVAVHGADAIVHTPPKSEDAHAAWHAWRDSGGTITPVDTFAPVGECAELRGMDVGTDRSGTHPALIIDALFGVGLRDGLPAEWTHVVEQCERLARAGTRILAVDCPSGLDCDSGLAPGGALRAHRCITFLADKPGLHTGRDADRAGLVRVATLSTQEEARRADADGAEGDSDGQDIGPGVLLGHSDDLACFMPERHAASHKGSHGHVLVVGGRGALGGAARLAARGALSGGAGKVSIATDEEAPHGCADPMRPEIMWAQQQPDPAALSGYDAIVIGCGLGTDEEALRSLEAVWRFDGPLVLDADALSLLAMHRGRHFLFDSPPALAAITPHPLEAARLLDCTVAQVESDRIMAARTLASRSACVVVLKGRGTVIAHPEGHWCINGTGNPLLATGGTGDVLAGIIGALCAALHAARETAVTARAACVGTWMHGAAADLLRDSEGPAGVPASELCRAMPRVWRRLMRD